MRKLLLLMFALLTGVSGAWAATVYSQGSQVTEASGLSNGNLYVIRVTNGSYITDTGTSYTAPNAQNSVTDASVYYLYTSDNGETWKIKNLSTGKYWATPTSEAVSGGFVPTEEATAGSFTLTFSGSNVIAKSGEYYINRSSGTMHGYKASGLTLSIYDAATATFATSLSDLSNNKCYTVTCNRSAWAVDNNGTSLTTIAKLNLAPLSSDPKQQFAFVTPDNGSRYYLYSIKAGKYVTSSNTLTDDATQAEPVYFADASSFKARAVRVYYNDSKNINVGGSNQITIDTWRTADDGCAYLIKEAGDFDPTDALAIFATTVDVTYNVKMGGVTVATATSKQLPGTSASLPTSLQNNYVTIGDPDISTVSDVNNVVNYTATLKEGFPFTYSTDYANATWYYWKLNGNYVSYAASTPYPASTTKPTTDAGLWAFIGTPYGTKIINKEAGSTKYLQDNSWAELTTTATDWVVANNTNKTIDFFTVHAGTNNYLNLQNNALKYWNDTRGATDNGSTFTVEEYSEDFAADVATYITPYFNTHGSYFSIKDDVYSTNSATWEAAKSTCTKATYDELFALVSNEDNIVWPATGLYLLKNHNSSQYLTATTTNLAMSSTSNVPSAIVRLTKNDDGTYYIQLQGLYVKTPTSSGTCSLGSTPVKFTPAIGTATKVSLTAAGGATSGYENITAHGGNAVGFPARGIDTDPYSYWSVEDATSIEVSLSTVGEASYSTLYVDFPVTIPSGNDHTAIYTLAESSGSYTLNKQTSAGAQQGIILRDINKAANVTLNIAASSDVTSSLTGSLLVGSAPENCYIFGNGDEGLGFYPYAQNSTLAANKAYLTLGSGVRSLVLNFDDVETGISNTDTSTQPSAIFDLQGRRAYQPQRGLYIVNGKKVLF